MALTLMRGIHYMNSRCQRKEGPWIFEQVKPIHRLRGQTFGIIGLGRIGTAAALRAKALGFKVVFYDPYVVDGTDKAVGVTRVEKLEDLLRQSDVVSLHCFRSAETQHIVNRDNIALMKPGSYLVNTARGGVVDAQAVLWGIEQNILRGAALDVLEIEPPLDTDPVIAAWRDPKHPAYDRLIINPHAAFYSEEGADDMRIKGSQNCRRVLLNQPPRNVVN
jgi:D-3-phosphoglycerate dehydrogenase/C-terminal binding protein